MAAAASLKLKNLGNANSKFSQLAAVVPGAATHVLIGRTYLDLHFDAEAAAHLRKALSLDPLVQRAHFYLAILDIMHEGSVNLPEAAREFKAELATYPDDYQSNLYLGVVLEQEHLSAEAQPYLTEAVKERPETADGYVYLANCYFEQGNYQGAVEAADKAIRLTPDPSVQNFRISGTHFILAQALRNLGESARAEQEAKIVRSLKQRANSASQADLTKYLTSVKQPEDAEALNSSVHWVRQQPSPEMETANQETARQLNQLLQDDLFNLGVLYLKQEKLDQAAAEFAAVFQQNPQYPGILKQYGTALFLLDKFDAAIPVLRQAVDSTPADEDSRSVLGQAFSKVGNYAEAVRVLSGVRWHDIPTLYALAISLARSGNDAGSARVFSVLIEEHKDSAEIEALQGQAASEQQLYTEAVQHFRKALALDPKVPEAHLGIGLIAMRSGELAAASQEIRLELASRPGDLRADFYLAYVLGMLQKHEEATLLLHKIVAQRPEFPEAHATLGSELMAQDRPREALDELLLAYKLDPKQAKLQYQIGQAYRKLGQMQEAEKSFALYRELQRQESEVHPSGGMSGDAPK
jgi:tetratricopeptide (TPR) repeat protein